MMPERSLGRSPSPTGRTLLSKLKTPFGPKSRNLSEFCVQLDDPHREYSAGHVITGSVVLKVVKPLRITHLVCRLHGFVQVYKTPNTPAESYRSYSAALAAGKTRKSGAYYGNGFMSLFEDEAVLCGEGRLGEGKYQFNFELQFPSHKLPSSIDFERGSISYMITSTLTRSTTIGPTTSCDVKVSYQEDVNIATFSKPKPCIISLDPIQRRTRTRRKPRPPPILPADQKQIDEKRQSTELTSDRRNVTPGNIGPSPAEMDPPQSPSPSDISFGSEPSSGSAVETNSLSARTGDSKLGTVRSGHSHSHSHRQLKPITATVELQQAAFLRGDGIQVKVLVHHTKQIKSLHGVIVTFYRQARVDPQPALPRSVSGKLGDGEEMPKPKTGLAALSISGSGSSRLYRKDLSQSFASIIINPNTLAAEVKATVRVPEGAFPSISTVPGGMISFKYYVEVVLDLQGKMAGLDRFLPNAGMTGISSHSLNGSMDSPGQTSHSVFAPWGGHFIDTEEIRRDKSVVSCTFEVVVGTRDSERKGKWQKQFPTPQIPNDPSDTTEIRRPAAANGDGGPQPYETEDDQRLGYQVPSVSRPQNDRPFDTPGYFDAPHRGPHSESPPPIHPIPVPDLAAEEQHLSEKERMRLREAHLLPSRPPDDGVEFASAGADNAPSAPTLDQTLPQLSHQPNRPPTPPLDGPYVQQARLEGPNAPSYHASTQDPTASDDKQELQRLRLEAERSAPPPLSDGDEDASAGASASASHDEHVDAQPNTAPSVPTLEDISLGFATATAHDPLLPRYER